MAFGLAVAGLLVVLGARAATMRSRQPIVTPLVDPPVDGQAIGRHLATSLRRQTVSRSTTELAPAVELDALHADLATAFPRTHATLSDEKVNGHALLFEWKGRDPGRAPIVLAAHQDVVPVEPGTEQHWTKPAFEGAIHDGFVWGRGALDDKASLVAILAAVEALVIEGFQPSRTIFLAFGHDEEVSGKQGAGEIVKVLERRNVRPEMVLDEGSAIVEGIVPGLAGPLAAIGIAEKGYFTIDLSVELPGGHSSTPPRESALTVLARAIDRLRKNPMPARLRGPVESFLTWAAPEMGFGNRVALANLWLTSPIVTRMFSSSQTLNASIRTTTAVTMMNAGVKDNVVPARASAVVNFRVLPGDTTEEVLAHVGRAIDDPRVQMTPRADTRVEASKIASTENAAFALLARTIREVFPGAVVAPSLVLGATDGRQYERLGTDVYRFMPFRLTATDIQRIHGKDERIATTALADGVRFYRQLVRAAAAP